MPSSVREDNTLYPDNPRLVSDLLDASVEEDNEEWEPPRCWRSSGLGSCLTSRYMARSGVRPEEHSGRTLRVFALGNLTEEFVLKALRKKMKISTQTSLFIKKWGLSGHVDVLIKDKKKVKTREEIWEIKTIRSDDFWNVGKKYPPKLQHRLQLWSYLHGLGKKMGRLIYISKDDQAVKEFLVREDEEVLAYIVEKEMEILNTAWEYKVAPPPVRFTDTGECVSLMSDDWQYRYSNYGGDIYKLPEYLDLTSFDLPRGLDLRRGLARIAKARSVAISKDKIIKKLTTKK